MKEKEKQYKSTKLRVIPSSLAQSQRLIEFANRTTQAVEATKNRLHNDLRKKVPDLYDNFVNCPNGGRGFAGRVIGTDYAPMSERKGGAVKGYDQTVAFHKKTLPYLPLCPIDIKDIISNNSGYRYALTTSIHTQLDSLNECEKLTNNEYKDRKKALDKTIDTLTREVDNKPKIVNQIDDLLSDWETQYGWFAVVDERFSPYYNEFILPSLLNGENPPTNGMMMVDGNKRRFPKIPKQILDSIKKNKSLWNYFGLESIRDYVVAKRNLERKKEHSQYTPTTLGSAPISIQLSYNGISIKSMRLTSDDFIEMSIRLLSNKDEILNLSYRTYKKYKDKKTGEIKKGPSKWCYLNNLQITNGKKRYTYNLSYTDRDGVEHKTPLSESFLDFRLKKKDHKIWFRNHVVKSWSYDDDKVTYIATNKDKVTLNMRTDFIFIVRFCFSVKEDSLHNINTKKAKTLMYDLMRSYPLRAPKGVSEDVKLSVPRNEFCVLGVDLGITNPYAYSLVRGDGKLIEQGLYPKESVFPEYVIFQKQCEVITRLIRGSRKYLRCLVDGVSEYDKDDHPICEDILNEVCKITGHNLTRDKYIKWLVNHKTTNDVYQDHKGILSTATYMMYKLYKKLLGQRYLDGSNRSRLCWGLGLKAYKGMVQSWTAWKLTKNGEKIERNKQMLSKIENQIQGVLEEYHRTVAHRLVGEIKKLSHKHNTNIPIIVFESLKFAQRELGKNEIWAFGKIKDWVATQLETKNVFMVEADERNSSQTINGMPGKRIGEKITGVDGHMDNADLNASYQIAIRALSNHTAGGGYRISYTSYEDNYLVPTHRITKKEGGKRVAGMLSRWYPKVEVWSLKDGYATPTNEKISKIKKLTKGKETLMYLYFTKIGKKPILMTEDEQVRIRESI